MQAVSKTLVLLLLAAISTAPLAVPGLRTDVSAHERSAGCHDDDGNAPAPGPVSHNCCLIAHHPAILQQSSTLLASLQGATPADFVRDSVAVEMSGGFPNLVIIPGDPPILSPLRV